MRETLTRFSLLVLLSFVVSLSVNAQSDAIINNVKNGLWSDPTVWSTNTVPTAEDSVVLHYDVRVNVNAFCKYLRLNGKNVVVDPGKTLLVAGQKPEIKENVHYIDSTKFTLTSTKSELNSGLYKYTFTGSAPTFKTGDVLVGITNDGYIRKVNTVNVSGNSVQMNTSGGNMNDVFGNANFNFTIAPGGASEVARTSNSTNTADAYSFGVTSKNLLTAGPVTLNLDTASIKFKPNFKFNFDFARIGGLQNFQMGCSQAALEGQMKFTIAANGTIAAEQTDTLLKQQKKTVVWIGEFPVLVVMDLYFISKVDFKTEASIQKTLTIDANALFDLGVRYNNGQWEGFSSYTPTANYTLSETNGKVKTSIDVALRPQFNIRFYNLAGPFIYLSFNNKLGGTYSAPSMNWDIFLDTDLEAGVGAEMKFVGDSVGTFGPKTWTKDLFSYRTPYKIQKISGDQQTFVDTSNYLPIPLKVQVLDTLGNPQRNVAVNFKVNKGGGSVRDTLMITDTLGYAETLWKYGASGFKQEVQVLVYTGDSTEIGEFPTYFRSGKDSLVLDIYNMSNTPAFTTNTFKSLGVGKGGFVWAGTQNQGLYTFDSSNWIKQSSILTNHNINQIQSDRDGTIWLAFTGSTTSIGGGLGAIRDSVVTSTSYTYYGAITTDAPNRNARSIFVDTTLSGRTSGLPNVWSAHMGNNQTVGDPSGSAGKGLLSASPYFKRIDAGVQTISLGGTGSCQIVGGDSSEVWVFANANFGRSQLLRYDTKTGSPKGFYDYSNVPTTVLRRAFFAKAIYFDAKGRNWVGLDTGVAVKQGNDWVRVWQPFVQFLPTNTFVNTHAIDGDSEGNIYIGTNNGFLLYIGGPFNDRSSWEYYTMADSLPSNNILGIRVDEKNGRVIFATDAGIAIWNR